MAYCSNCGTQLEDEATFCPNCGMILDVGEKYNSNIQQQTTHYNQSPPKRKMDPYDSGSFGWAVLGFFVPLVGLILFLVWAQTKPKSAKMAGIGALVSVIMTVVFYVLYFILILALAPSSSTSSILLW